MSDEKIGRNDLCFCGSGKKYKSCCMPRTGKLKGILKNFGKYLITDNIKRIPIADSLINAIEDTNSDMKENESALDIEEIRENTEYSATILSNIESMSPLLSPQSSINKLIKGLELVNFETNNNPDFNLEIIEQAGKKTIKISPKKQDLKFNVHFKLSAKEFDGKTDIMEIIESKLKEGKSIIFTEEEIEKIVIDHPQFKNLTIASGLEILPTSTIKPLILDFLIESTNEGYHNVEMRQTYGNKHEGTLLSSNLPFEIVLYLNLDLKITKFNTRFKLDDIPILDLNKLLNFLNKINSGDKLICRNSRRENTYFSSEVTTPTEIDERLIAIVQKLANIDKYFKFDLMFPDNIETNDHNVINALNSFINEKFIRIIIGDISITVDSEILKKMIEDYELDGYVHNISITQEMIVNLFDKEINLGNGLIDVPKSTFFQDIEVLKKSIKDEGKSQITLIPLENKTTISF